MNNTQFVHFKKDTRKRNGSFLFFGITACLLVIFALTSFASFQSEKSYDIIGGQYIKKEIDCNAYIGNAWDFFYNGTDGRDGSEQEFLAPCDGVYILEAWGAQGGTSLVDDVNEDNDSGYGGYATGLIELATNNRLYINVGGKGWDAKNKINVYGGYNGGGSGSHDQGDDESSGGGGGASHIAKVSGLLDTLSSYKGEYNEEKGTYISDDIIMVAGGGGGKSYTYPAGSGGGYKGGITSSTSSNEVSQNNGYSFGKGQNASGKADSDGVGGGGGGFFGGYMNNVFYESSGSGGSGYIGNPSLREKAMYCYDCEETDGLEIKTISTTGNSELLNSTSCPDGYSDSPVSKCAKAGNGHIKVTYLGSSKIINYSEKSCQDTIMYGKFNNLCTPTKQGYEFMGWYYNDTLVTNDSNLPDENLIMLNAKWEFNKIPGTTLEFPYNGTDGTDGSEQEFTVPVNGLYKIEVWGAQGGNSSSASFPGGYGGYSVGEINLQENEILYINVGGAGYGDGTHTLRLGGYNGGGTANKDNDGNTRNASGGGATHVSKVSGLLKDLETYKGTLSADGLYYISNDIILVGAGGGGFGFNSALGIRGTIGHAGGYIGKTGYYNQEQGYYGYGGEQIKAGSSSRSNDIGDGSFGQGASATAGGAGGGFFGGGSFNYGNGGGSSYIANPNLTNKAMYCYTCTEETTNDNLKTYDTTSDHEELDKTNCPNGYSDDPVSKCAKLGNGYVKITYLGE